MGYNAACELMVRLEVAGVVGEPDSNGNRSHLLTKADMREPNRDFIDWSLREFEGCDCTDPGSPQDPYVWMFGLEFGEMPAAGAAAELRSRGDQTYSIEEQLTYTFNRQAFKLLAVAHGRPMADYVQFAREVKPFVRGSRGYFKGNLYPYACKNLEEWPDDVRAEVGLEKEEYRLWCDEHRIPVLHGWVNKYQPMLFIGVGLTAASLFERVMFGQEGGLAEHKFSTSNGQVKRVLQRRDAWRKLIVLPHLSGGMHGLNSDDSVETAGTLVGELLRS